jgi:hypothetical protein
VIKFAQWYGDERIPLEVGFWRVLALWLQLFENRTEAFVVEQLRRKKGIHKYIKKRVKNGFLEMQPFFITFNFMRFIKYNYSNDTSFSFCLNDVVIFETDGTGTKVVLRNIDEAILLPIDPNDFVAKVFDDMPDENEYHLIEIDEPDTDDKGLTHKSGMAPA